MHILLDRPTIRQYWGRLECRVFAMDAPEPVLFARCLTDTRVSQVGDHGDIHNLSVHTIALIYSLFHWILAESLN